MPAMSRKQPADAIEDDTTMIVAALRARRASGDNERRTSREATTRVPCRPTYGMSDSCWTDQLLGNEAAPDGCMEGARS